MPAEPAPAEQTGPYQPTDAMPGGLIAGRYRLREKVGEGGMGEVWVAEQTEPVRRKVAVKLIKPGMDSKAVLSRFEAERQALALMDHPNIAKVLDGGTTDTGRPFFVMEYVKGMPITQYCDEARLTVAQRLELFIPVCQAVQHAHQKGIIHRDLKPSNILVCLYDGKPVPKVIDFGLAKALHQPLTDHTLYTAHGLMLGTPLYMSPEQAEVNNLDIDTGSDVYSLGVILYELLTGSTPLERRRLKQAAWQEMLRLIKEEEPPRPSTRLSGSGTLPRAAAQRQVDPAKLTKLVRGELDWIAMKALAKERGRRYETANGLARDIQRYLHDEPVEACPPSVAYRVRKVLRRYRGPVVAAAVVLLALVGGVVGTTWGLLKAKAQQERAEAKERQALEEKQIADAVRDFLQTKLLGQADTRAQAFTLLGAGRLLTAAKHDVTVRELLDRAAAELAPEKIEDRFPGQPLVQAEILRTVGIAYRAVGGYGSAVSFLQRAAGLYRQQLGPDHLVTLATLNDLARAYTGAGESREAIRLFEQVRATYELKRGPDDPNTLTVADNLAGVYMEAGRLPEAIKLFEQVRAARETNLGPDHLDTLTTLNNLASAYASADRPAEAFELFERVHARFAAQRGPDHPDTLAIRSNLAGAYWAAGNWPEAFKLLKQVHAAQAARLGPDHPDTLHTLHPLALAYGQAGKLPEAIKLLEQVRLTYERNLGPDHPYTLGALNDLAGMCWSAKQLDRSIPLFEDLLKRSEAKLGRDDPQTLLAVFNLGVSYRDAGRLDEAMPLPEEAYRKAPASELAVNGENLATAYARAGKKADASRLVQDLLARARKQLPPESAPLAGALTRGGRQLLALKEYAEAEPLLRECLALREKLASRRDGPGASPALAPWQMASVRSYLGGALLGQKKYAEAKPLLLAGAEGLMKEEQTIPWVSRSNVPDALERLVELYETTGKPDQAAKWRKQLEARPKP